MLCKTAQTSPSAGEVGVKPAECSGSTGNTVRSAVWKFSYLDQTVPPTATINRRSIKRRHHVQNRPASLQALPKPEPLGAKPSLGPVEAASVIPAALCVLSSREVASGSELNRQRWSSVDSLSTSTAGGRKTSDIVSLFEAGRQGTTTVSTAPLFRSGVTADEPIVPDGGTLPTYNDRNEQVRVSSHPRAIISNSAPRLAGPRAPLATVESDEIHEDEAPGKSAYLVADVCSLRRQCGTRRTKALQALYSQRQGRDHHSVAGDDTGASSSVTSLVSLNVGDTNWKSGSEDSNKIGDHHPVTGSGLKASSSATSLVSLAGGDLHRKSAVEGSNKIRDHLSALTLTELQRYVRQMPLPSGSPPSKPPRSFTHDDQETNFLRGRRGCSASARSSRAVLSRSRAGRCRGALGAGVRLLRMLPCVTASSEYGYTVGGVADHASQAASFRTFLMPLSDQHIYDVPFTSECCHDNNNNNSGGGGGGDRGADLGDEKHQVQPYAVSDVIFPADANFANKSVRVRRRGFHAPRLRRTCSDDSLISGPAKPPSGENGTPLLKRKPAILRRQKESLRHANNMDLSVNTPLSRCVKPAPSSVLGVPSASTSIACAAPERPLRRVPAGSSTIRTAGEGSSTPSEEVLLRSKHVQSVCNQMRRHSEVDGHCPLISSLVILGLSADVSKHPAQPDVLFQHPTNVSKHPAQPDVLFQHPTNVDVPDCVGALCASYMSGCDRLPGRSSAETDGAQCVTNSTFCVTFVDGGGRLVYGVCRSLPQTKYSSPVIYCLLSHRPAPTLYTEILSVLTELHFLSESERRLIVSRLCSQPLPAVEGSARLPLPPVSSAAVLGSQKVADEWVVFDVVRCRDWLPLSPHFLFDLLWLLERVGVDLLISLFSSALLERRIIFSSRNSHWLWRAVSAVLVTICPYVWQHRMEPVLPDFRAPSLADSAPCLVGVAPSARPLSWLKPGDQCVCVDLDSSCLLFSVGDELSILSASVVTSLRHQLTRHCFVSSSAEPARSESAADAVHRSLISTLTRLIGSDLAGSGHGDAATLRNSLMEKCTSEDTRQFLSWFCETSHFRWLITSLRESNSEDSPFSPPEDCRFNQNSEAAERFDLLIRARSTEHKLRRKLCRPRKKTP